MLRPTDRHPRDRFVRVRGARENNLRELDVDIPRDALVVFTGVSGSGKSSLAFSTLYAEAQRRFLESVSPYARRLFDQMPPPQFDSIDGLPPAIALQQQRGSATTRSSVGSVTTLSNLLRMLYSRAGDYPRGQPLLYAESFSANTPQGACPTCQGTGRMYEVTERSMVPDDRLTIRQRAVAAWPQAWGGQNLRDILVTLGYDVDKPWHELSKKAREWILFTDEQPTVPVYAGISPADVRRALKRKDEPSYMGTFSSARRHVLHTFASSHSPMMKRRAARYILSRACELCGGKRLRLESLAVTFAGLDITEMSRLALDRMSEVFTPYAQGRPAGDAPEKQVVTQRVATDLVARLGILLELGLGYLTLERNTPTLSPGELQRLRLATAVYSNLFGVVYVLDEPSAGLHPVDTEALLGALERLKSAGNSLFVVEHDLDVIRRADWIVDIGPVAGEGGGRVLYSGPLPGLADVEDSLTRVHLFDRGARARTRTVRSPRDWLRLVGVTRNNLDRLDADIPIGVFTSVTGVSGSGKSSLVSQALVELVAGELGLELDRDDLDSDRGGSIDGDSAPDHELATAGAIVGGLRGIRRLVCVDQRPIGRTPRSNLATYTGLFDHVRKLFAATKAARTRKYDAGRFSFNMPKGRCATCEGEGLVYVEMLFLPSVYAPCSACHGTRYNPATLEIEYRGKSIADVLRLTVDAAFEFFVDDVSIHRMLGVLRQVGLGYLRLGQPATELSGGEAQRIKLATELQRAQRGDTLYVLDEPTTGLHPADVEKLVAQLHSLVDAGNTVVVVEHEMRVVADSDWVIDVGPGAGAAGGKIVVAGTSDEVAHASISKTAPYLRRALERETPHVISRTRRSR